MEERDIRWLEKVTRGELRPGAGTGLLRGVTTDSRAAGPGQVFVALRGDRFDGHDFLGEVVEAGVGAVVVGPGWETRVAAGCAVVTVADPRKALGRMGGEYRREFGLPVVAVAGSNGKTTSKELLAAVLETRGPVLRSEASFNNDIGVPLTLMRLERKHWAAVLEAGTNHPGELAPLLGWIRPDFGLLTGIGREHLEFFGDLPGVAAEEGALAEGLGEDGVLVMNGDSEFSGSVARRCAGRVIRFGTGMGQDWRVTSSRAGWDGERFRLETGRAGWSGEWWVGVPGRHMAINASGVLGLAAEMGVEPEAAREVLAGFRAPKQRLEVFEAGGVRVLNDCYNANADSMLAALETLYDLPCAGRRVAVLGDMNELGSLSEPAHGEIGARAAEVADAIFAQGRHAERTIASARRAGAGMAAVHGEVGALMEAVAGYVRAGDVVLVKASRSARLERVTEGLLARLGKEGEG